MSGAAKARNKARSKRGYARPGAARAAAGAQERRADEPAKHIEAEAEDVDYSGCVPAPRTVEGLVIMHGSTYAADTGAEHEHTSGAEHEHTGTEHEHASGTDHMHASGTDHMHASGTDHMHASGTDHMHASGVEGHTAAGRAPGHGAASTTERGTAHAAGSGLATAGRTERRDPTRGGALPVPVEVPPVAVPLDQTGGSFARGYPAPADAVRCAMLGSPPTFWFDGDSGRLTVAVEAGRLAATGVAYVAEDLACLVAAVALNHHGGPAEAIEPVRVALAAMAASAGEGEVEIMVDLSGLVPRLGWLSRFDPASWVTWHDWWASFTASGAGRISAAVAGAGRTGEFDHCFRAQGLRVVRCADPGCAAPLTDRHPAWPGRWTAPGGALGPVCPAASRIEGWPAGLLAAGPHRVVTG